MSDAPAVRSTRAFAAVVLVVVGLGLWGLYRFTASGDPYAYAPGAQAPETITLQAGHTYHLAITGGASALPLGQEVANLQCTFTTVDGESSQLVLSADSTKATNDLGSFTGPVSARGRVACTGLSNVFVAGDDAPFDISGLFLVLAIVALTIGAPLLLSVLRRPSRDE